jgi:hypothetical protein
MGTTGDAGYVYCDGLYSQGNNPEYDQRWKTYDYGSSDTKRTEDVVNRQYLSRRNKGEVFNNPFLSIVSKTENPLASFDYANGMYDSDGFWWGRRYSGSIGTGWLLPDFVALYASEHAEMLADVRDRAVTMAFANRSLVEQAVSMTLAEGKKTIQGVYEILFRVAEIALAAKRLDWRYIRSEFSPAELADRYMELRYALRPLMIDAENVVKAANTNLGKSRKTARGGADDRFVVTEPFEGSNTNIPTFSFRGTATSSYIVEARAGILCDVERTSLNIWGVDQIAQTVYEVVPFSFILGWFLNVADLISSWAPVAGVNELASWVTVSETLVQEVKMDDAWISLTFDPNKTVQCNAVKRLYWKQVTRTPNPERTVWPQLNVNLDSLKLIDLGIILRGIISGRITKFHK